jgi:type III secretion protein N (ATPase)
MGASGWIGSRGLDPIQRTTHHRLVPAKPDFEKLRSRLEPTSTMVVEGRVSSLTGLTVRARLPGARVGDTVEVLRVGGDCLLAEIRGFSGGEVVLVPLGDVRGVGPEDVVRQIGVPLSFKCGEAALGRILDGLGRPIDGRGPIAGAAPWPLMRPPPPPLARPPIQRRLSMGVRAIDALLTAGEGQRIGLFAGSGVGKSTLMGQIARGTEADAVVVALVGERGREVQDFIMESLGERGLARSVVVCSTSDEPALLRLKAAFVATAAAEYFRDRGARVLLLMDSVTRVARAQREVGLAAGEPPVRRGYPPSVFALLPQLLERTGASDRGSITAVYTVLVEGDDMEEPIADEVRGILDGHIVLSRELATRGQWPAIDVPASLSRLMDRLVPDEHRIAAARVRRWIATYERQRHLIELGAYQRGTDKDLDEAAAMMPGILVLLNQGRDTASTGAEASEHVVALARRGR